MRLRNEESASPANIGGPLQVAYGDIRVSESSGEERGGSVQEEPPWVVSLKVCGRQFNSERRSGL